VINLSSIKVNLPPVPDSFLFPLLELIRYQNAVRQMTFFQLILAPYYCIFVSVELEIGHILFYFTRTTLGQKLAYTLKPLDCHVYWS